MSQSLSKTPSRFSIFLILTNLSIFLLLLFWLWQYWRGGLTSADASNIDDFFNRQARFLIFNKYVFEPYIFDFVLILVPAFIIFLSYGIAEQTKKLVIANTLLAIHSVLVLIACIFIQSKIGVLHLWASTGISAISQNALSSYFMNRQKAESQDFDKTSSWILWIISVLTFILYIYSLAIHFASL